MVEPKSEMPKVSKADALRFLLTRYRRGQHAAIMALAAKYGSSFQANIQGKNFFVINDPQWLRHILLTHQRHYTKAAIFARLGSVLGKGLFTADGSFWKRQRQLIQAAYSPKQLALYAPAVEAHCQALVARFEAQASSGQRCDIYPELVHFTLDVVMETILGSTSRQFHSQVHSSISIIIDQMERASFRQRLLDFMPLLRFYPFWKKALQGKHDTKAESYEAALATFNSVLVHIVAQRQQEMQGDSSDDHRDVLSLLIKARDEKREGMSEEQLRDELAIAFVAGHETSAVALAWTFVLLAQNPLAGERLRQELKSVLGGQRVQLHHLPSLIYTRAVIEETLRLYPPVWRLVRSAAVDDKLGETLIPEGSTIVMIPFLTHRLSDYWAEPDSFRPERFLSEGGGREPMSYLPFGAGPRVCIGQNFAMNEMMLALASVWQEFELELDPATDLAIDAKLSLRPRYPLWMRVKKR